MSPIIPNLERQKNAFQSELLHRVSTATEEFPTVRCWSSHKLRSLLGSLRSLLHEQRVLTSSFPRTDGLLTWLIEAGLVHPLPVEPGVSTKTEDTFYLVEVGSGSQSTVSPFELLQAFQPQGIVSFFSALSFHSLTTQAPPFHHSVALTPRPPAISRTRAVPEVEPAAAPATSLARRDPLGSHAFTYAATRYFSTKRFRDLVPGVQIQILDPRIHLRVTDIEQTLLDTLMHPEASGGQSVIFEAWEQGRRRARPERLAGYVEAIALPVLTRRLGALFNLTGAAIPASLRSVFEQTKHLLAVDSVPQVPLFRGQSGTRLDPEWNVLTPA